MSEADRVPTVESPHKDRPFKGGPMPRRLITILTTTLVLGGLIASTVTPVLACAGLIGSNGAVNLGRTTTLAAYHEGVEHYVTAFQFLGGGGQFGTLIPLPGVPTTVERGGGWTLQRLVRETQPVRTLRAEAFAAGAAQDSVQVLLQTRVDALDLTVLSGGSHAVADWALDHGFSLSPDAPEVLDFYAKRSPVFLAAVFDAEEAAARGQQVGDGTPIQISIPTSNPWVPLRILGLGKQPGDRVAADVFLMTDQQPAFLPRPAPGFQLAHNAVANARLLDDLRSDDRMEWVPDSAWLTQLRLDISASDLAYDLAVDASGQGTPSRRAAGLDPEGDSSEVKGLIGPIGLLFVLLGLPATLAARRRAPWQ